MLASRVRMATFKDGPFIPEWYVLASDSDFSGTIDGAFKYIGTNEYIIIPNVIKGVPVTSYGDMFESNSVIKGVASNNTDVTDMMTMFYNSSTTTLDLSNLDTSSVTNMEGMFAGSSATTLDLSSFDTSSVTNMDGMFAESNATTLDLSSFDTSKVTSMNVMFVESRATTLDLSSFDTSSVTSMSGMFESSSATTLDLGSFDTSNVIYMNGMFESSSATTLDLSSFDTSNVLYMNGMFADSSVTALDLSSFDTSNVLYMDSMFQNSSATTGYARTQEDADRFNVSSNKPVGLNFIPIMATDDDFTWVDTSEFGEDAPPSFYLYTGTKEIVKLPESINNIPLTSTSNMFLHGEEIGFSYTAVVKVILTHANVTDMSYMFNGSQATTLDLSSFDTSNVTNMSNMFQLSEATTLDLSSFDTSNVTNMSNMFNMSQATIGYARTQADADRFNASSYKPAGLTFIVKP